jgi:RsiW-degrading membrane proteinase PrsW (M82 family)
MSQNYGALRVVRVRPAANARADLQNRYPTGWLPEERLVHLLVHRETTIGRALTNDIILMDPTVSREHARLVLDEHGWHIVNLTLHNIVRVNGHTVPSGESWPMRPQDVLVLGSTMLQLVAPELPEALPAIQADEAGSESDRPTLRLGPLRQFRPGIPHAAHSPNEAPYSPMVEWGSKSGHAIQRGRNGHEASAPLRTSAMPPQQIQPPQHMQQSPAAQFTPLAIPQAGPSSQLSPVPPRAHQLPVQPEPEQVAKLWQDEESVLGAGVTMQFALPQRMGLRTRWLIAGVGITILLVSAIITIVLNGLIGISAFAQNGPASVLEALTIPLIPAIGINLLVNFLDRFEREPWFLRLAAFLWGAVIAIPPAFFIELDADAVIQKVPGLLLHSLLQGLNAGVTEETIKGLGLLLLFVILRDEFDNVTDGIVYGALIGAGFAMVENFVYFARNGKDFLVLMIVGRVVLGWLCHSTFTVCFGAALGYVRHTRVRWKQIVYPLLGYLVAVGLHSVFDFIDFFASATALAAPNDPRVTFFALLAIIGDYIPPFIAQIGLLYILIKALAHEAAVIREFLASEVSSGVVRVDEYELLQNSFQRTKRERRVLFTSGVKQWLRVKALYQTEIGLAFRKWHVDMGDKPKLGYLQPEDAYRQRIKRLRQEIRVADMRGGS